MQRLQEDLQGALPKTYGGNFATETVAKLSPV
jgi:hypothetical protein